MGLIWEQADGRQQPSTDKEWRRSVAQCTEAG